MKRSRSPPPRLTPTACSCRNSIGRPTESGRVFGSVAGSGTNIAVLIRRNLEAAVELPIPAWPWLTDGCPGLQGRVSCLKALARALRLGWNTAVARSATLPCRAATIMPTISAPGNMRGWSTNGVSASDCTNRITGHIPCAAQRLR